MIIIEQAQAVALKLKNPSKVLDTIPTAKLYHHRTGGIVLVPHGVQETKLLRSMRFKVPAPMLSYYDWKGDMEPYKHQKMTAAFLTMHHRAIVLNEIGTGKTLSALWAADYLMGIGAVRKCLILAPLSTLEKVWGDEIFTVFHHRKSVTLSGAAARRRKLLGTSVDFYIINYEGFPIIASETLGEFDLVIADEAAMLRNPSTNRSKTFRKWIGKQPDIRLWMMTGAPTPNGPPDAWALATLANNPYCTQSFTKFRDMVMMKVGQWRYIPRPEAADIVKHSLQPSIRYTRDKCLDLPGTVYQTRRVKLSMSQEKHYKEMMKHFTTEAREAGGTISAVNEVVKLQKLIQIACGVAYAEDGKHIELDCAPRVALVKEIIEEVGGKVLIFTPLLGTMTLLENRLKKHWTMEVVNGSTTLKKRSEIFRDFQAKKDPHIILAHPATMSHGLTLTAADAIVWYGPITSNDRYIQANGRVERIGKRHVANVIHIESTPLERQMYERLKNKQALQGLLLDMIQQQTGE